MNPAAEMVLPAKALDVFVASREEPTVAEVSHLASDGSFDTAVSEGAASDNALSQLSNHWTRLILTLSVTSQLHATLPLLHCHPDSQDRLQRALEMVQRESSPNNVAEAYRQIYAEPAVAHLRRSVRDLVVWQSCERVGYANRQQMIEALQTAFGVDDLGCWKAQLLNSYNFLTRGWSDTYIFKSNNARGTRRGKKRKQRAQITARASAVPDPTTYTQPATEERQMRYRIVVRNTFLEVASDSESEKSCSCQSCPDRLERAPVAQQASVHLGPKPEVDALALVPLTCRLVERNTFWDLSSEDESAKSVCCESCPSRIECVSVASSDWPPEINLDEHLQTIDVDNDRVLAVLRDWNFDFPVRRRPNVLPVIVEADEPIPVF